MVRFLKYNQEPPYEEVMQFMQQMLDEAHHEFLFDLYERSNSLPDAIQSFMQRATNSGSFNSKNSMESY